MFYLYDEIFDYFEIYIIVIKFEVVLDYNQIFKYKFKNYI